MLDDAGMVGTTTPAGGLPPTDRRQACSSQNHDFGRTLSVRLFPNPPPKTADTVQEEAPAMNDLEQRFAALRK